MMTPPKFIAIFAAMGLLVPVVFRAVWYFLNQHPNLKVDLIAEKLMLVLWPVVWLLLLPFRLIGIAFEALFAMMRAILFLPARMLGYRG